MNNKKYSVSDLLLFYESPYAFWCKTVNSLIDKGKADESRRIPETESNVYSEYFIKKTQTHEINLKDHYLIKKEMTITDFSNNGTFENTLKSIKNKSQVIYQGSIEGNEFTGRPDFLVLNSNNKYDIVDAKFSKNIKTKYALQLYCYGYLLNEIEGYFPEMSSIYLIGDQFIEVQIQDYAEIFSELKSKFFKFVKNFDIDDAPHPFKNEYSNNVFADQIKEVWFEKESLELIGGITYKQVKELNQFGINTLKELVNCEVNPSNISNKTFSKLYKKANALKKSNKEIFFEINKENVEDLYAIEALEHGDLYIDFEWYPYSGELDNFFYLFGYFQNKKEESSFGYLWSDREYDEERNVKQFVDFLINHNVKYPDAKIYHYNHSEKTELLKLCEKYDYKNNKIKKIIDNSFVDLLKPIRNSFIMGLTSNSLKEVEKVLNIERIEEVQSGGQSMQYFENFYFEDNWDLKDEIINYNEQDCKNLYVLHKWLVNQKYLLKT